MFLILSTHSKTSHGQSSKTILLLQQFFYSPASPRFKNTGITLVLPLLVTVCCGCRVSASSAVVTLDWDLSQLYQQRSGFLLWVFSGMTGAWLGSWRMYLRFRPSRSPLSVAKREERGPTFVTHDPFSHGAFGVVGWSLTGSPTRSSCRGVAHLSNATLACRLFHLMLS